MKIDRLLSIVIYLMNHDLVSARVLAEKFEVTTRTIQRDIESIELAGIPIVTVQGANGGYGIMDNFKMDKQLVSTNDLYYIITALQSVGETLADNKIDNTIEKMKNLVPTCETDFLEDKNSKLSMDFTMLGGDPRLQESFKVVKKAVDSERLLTFTYTNNRLQSTSRIVEPMTIAFKWRGWYLYAWCTLKEDYRLFRISRIREPEIISKHFKRRDKTFNDFIVSQERDKNIKTVELVLQFDKAMRAIVEEYHRDSYKEEGPNGSLIVRTSMPEDGWMYGFILSYGEFVTVIEPPHIRDIIRKSAQNIEKKYN